MLATPADDEDVLPDLKAAFPEVLDAMAEIPRLAADIPRRSWWKGPGS